MFLLERFHFHLETPENKSIHSEPLSPSARHPWTNSNGRNGRRQCEQFGIREYNTLLHNSRRLAFKRLWFIRCRNHFRRTTSRLIMHFSDYGVDLQNVWSQRQPYQIQLIVFVIFWVPPLGKIRSVCVHAPVMNISPEYRVCDSPEINWLACPWLKKW